MSNIEYSKLEETFESIKSNGLSSLTPPKYKPPKQRIPADYNWQIKCLKENGIQIDNEQTCLQTLRDITYYRLKGYLCYFRQFKRKGKGVKVDFETLLNIHEFDGKMRVILLRALSKIEIHLRAQFSYFFSSRYGAYGYLDAANYSREKKKPKQAVNDSSKVEDKPVHNHQKFLNSLQKSIIENIDLEFVRHYVEKHDGVMPFWVMSELMGFGQWFYFYKGMKREDQDYPNAEEWNTKILRNIKSLLKEYCAKGIDKGCIGFPPDWEIWLEKP